MDHGSIGGDIDRLQTMAVTCKDCALKWIEHQEVLATHQFEIVYIWCTDNANYMEYGETM